jgi:hypothetical protein
MVPVTRPNSNNGPNGEKFPRAVLPFLMEGDREKKGDAVSGTFSIPLHQMSPRIHRPLTSVDRWAHSEVKSVKVPDCQFGRRERIFRGPLKNPAFRELLGHLGQKCVQKGVGVSVPLNAFCLSLECQGFAAEKCVHGARDPQFGCAD